MSVRSTCLMAMLLAGATSAWAQHTSVQVKPVHFGTIAGSVVDARGLVQSGILVTLTRQDGLFAQKVFTRRNGHFDFGKLSPGLYAVEINLPNFLPFSKAPIALAAGNDIVLDITLRTLAESMEIGLPANPAKAQDDW